MYTKIHDFTTSLDVEACTEVFTYFIVVFLLTRLCMEELGPEVRRLGRLPPSTWLYLASILFWPITLGFFASVSILGVLHAIFDKAYTLGARGLKGCHRWITSCILKSRQTEDLEMGVLVPSHPEGVSGGDAEAEHQAELAYREVVATLKEEYGLTPDKWGRASRS